MANITINVPNSKYQRVKDAIFYIMPNSETEPDPAWVDPGDGSTAPLVPKYTDNQWMKEVIRRQLIELVKASERQKLITEASQSELENTDDLAS